MLITELIDSRIRHRIIGRLQFPYADIKILQAYVFQVTRKDKCEGATNCMKLIVIKLKISDID